MMAQEFITTGGIDYARELLEKSLGTQKAVDIINRLTSSLQVRPFRWERPSLPRPGEPALSPWLRTWQAAVLISF